MSTVTGRGGRASPTKDRPEPGDVLTSGQAARLMKVSPRTVCAWIDDGRLKGYRLPASNDRRIHYASLIDFMLTHGMFRRSATVLVSRGDGLLRAEVHERWGSAVARVAFRDSPPEAGVDWLPGVESRYLLKVADAEAFQVLMDAGFRFLDGR